MQDVARLSAKVLAVCTHTLKPPNILTAEDPPNACGGDLPFLQADMLLMIPVGSMLLTC